MVKALFETAPQGPTANIAAAMQALVPVLTTDRLVLRAPRIEDFDAFADMVLGPRGAGFGAPATRTEAWAEFIQMTGTWALRGHGAWAVTLRGGDTCVGFVLIGAEPGDMEPELGWILSADAEGKGFAQEAAEAARGHAFGPFELGRLVSYIDDENPRSHAVAERLGAIRDAQAEAALPETDRCRVYRHHKDGGL